MAKKKASVKKAKVSKTGKKVSSPKAKKIVKKTVSKSKVKAKKTAATKKSAVKKTAKKVVKKSSKVAKKLSSVKKAPSKKAVKRSEPKKKAAKNSAGPKVAAAKSTAKKGASANVYGAPILKSAPLKKLDLSQFVTPLDDRILIQPEKMEKMTPGGLYIPDTVSDVSGNLQGYVVAVGRGHMNKKGHVRPMDVQVGDKIIFNEYSGSKITIQNEDLIILREVEVMGVVSK